MLHNFECAPLIDTTFNSCHVVLTQLKTAFQLRLEMLCETQKRSNSKAKNKTDKNSFILFCNKCISLGFSMPFSQANTYIANWWDSPIRYVTSKQKDLLKEKLSESMLTDIFCDNGMSRFAHPQILAFFPEKHFVIILCMCLIWGMIFKNNLFDIVTKCLIVIHFNKCFPLNVKWFIIISIII